MLNILRTETYWTALAKLFSSNNLNVHISGLSFSSRFYESLKNFEGVDFDLLRLWINIFTEKCLIIIFWFLVKSLNWTIIGARWVFTIWFGWLIVSASITTSWRQRAKSKIRSTSLWTSTENFTLTQERQANLTYPRVRL